MHNFDQLAGEQRWPEAAQLLEDVRRPVKLAPVLAVPQAVIYLHTKQEERYRAVCADALNGLKPALTAGDRTEAATIFLGRLCTIGPNGLADWEDLLKATARLEEAIPNLGSDAPPPIKAVMRYRALCTRTAVLFRAGKQPEALHKPLGGLAEAGREVGEG